MVRDRFPDWWDNKRGADGLALGDTNGTKKTEMGIVHYAWPVTWNVILVNRLGVPALDSGHVIYSPQRYVWQHWLREEELGSS